jgi:hypothetical protein
LTTVIGTFDVQVMLSWEFVVSASALMKVHPETVFPVEASTRLKPLNDIVNVVLSPMYGFIYKAGSPPTPE